MRLSLTLVSLLLVSPCLAQSPPQPNPATTIPLEPQPPTPLPQAPTENPDQAPAPKPNTADAVTVTSKPDTLHQQPTRILGILPNYRAVSAGAPAPPNSAKLNAKIATEQSLDYSAFLFGGLTSLISEGRNTHPSFGKGPNGYGQYLWRNNVDRVDRNFQQTFLFPSLYHEDPRYYAMEKGNVFRRITYASTRVVITRTYSGKETFNFASISGKLGSEAVSTLYYPSRNLDISALGIRLGYSVAREAAFTTFREFYPDIAAKFRHKRTPERGSEPYSNTSPQPLSTRPPS